MVTVKRTAAFVFGVVFFLSLLSTLAGCNKNPTTGIGNISTPSPTPTNSANAAADGTDAADAAATPEPAIYVYHAEFLPLSGAGGNGFTTFAYQNGRILAGCYEKIGENIPEGVTPEYEGQYDIYGTKLYSVGLDGRARALEGYQPLEADENGSASIIDAAVTPEGGMVSLEALYRQVYDGPDDVELYSDEWYQKQYYVYLKSEQNYYLRFLAADGSEEQCLLLDDELKNALGGSWQDFYYPQGFVLDDRGRIYINFSQPIVALDADGSFRQVLESPSWVESMFRLRDGRIAVICFEEDGRHLRILDTESVALDRDRDYPLGSILNVTEGGGEFDFYYTSGSNFMGYSLAESKAEKLFNWINTDLEPPAVNPVFVTEDGQIVTLSSERDENTAEIKSSVVLVREIPATSLPDKTVLTLAVMGLEANLQSLVMKFNRSSPDARIEVLDYSEYGTPEAGLTRLNTEIMAGDVPDILSLNGLSVRKLTVQGILADLLPYLNADEELKDQMLDGVLEALMIDGKLYRTASGFSIETVVGAASVVGDTPGWTLDQFSAALAQMPEGCEPFSQGTTRDTILTQCLSMELDRLIDFSSGVCTFDTPVFTDILTFAAQFPKEFDWTSTEREDDFDRIEAGRQMLHINRISDFQSFQMYDAIFGGDATFIGFPTTEGTGSMMNIDGSGYAICAKSENKDQAWQFLRTLMTADYQEQIIWSLPTNRVAFEKSLENAMTPQYLRNADGSFLLDENGERIEQDRMVWRLGSLTVHIKALTWEQADKLLELLRTTTKVRDYDTEIMAMITGEAEAFFSGQKTAKEVGQLLQSKVTIYINEQR